MWYEVTTWNAVFYNTVIRPATSPPPPRRRDGINAIPGNAVGLVRTFVYLLTCSQVAFSSRLLF